MPILKPASQQDWTTDRRFGSLPQVSVDVPLVKASTYSFSSLWVFWSYVCLSRCPPVLSTLLLYELYIYLYVFSDLIRSMAIASSLCSHQTAASSSHWNTHDGGNEKNAAQDSTTERRSADVENRMNEL